MNSEKPSYLFSFDRAAEIYDATRSFPPGVAEEIAAKTLPLLPGSRRTLEIGIGTGRVSLPLLRENVPVTGIDVSARMMEKLREKLNDGGGKPDLVQAEAGWLPFLDRSFDAVFGVHVFHLLPDLEAVAVQVLRVLRSSGVVLAGYDDRDPDQPGEELRSRWREIERDHNRSVSGRIRWEYEDVHRVFTDLGARFTGRIPIATWNREFIPEKFLNQWDQGYYSHTWDMAEVDRRRILTELRQVVIDQYGTLEVKLEDKYNFIWYCYELD